ncbi:MAG: (E)-4-hydroxy-3-methylbut-2-enyl-diphosphate synthase [Verrucomicrobiae bacterium]|nr:(E)-4-hydroxy-3-methylbut-2-enyl-diphosphate synthase [Verrucomicrobiae bacterium]
MRYCPNPFVRQRRPTREVKVGNVGIGGSNPIRIQTMLTSDTMDTDACVREAIPILEAGCELLRLTVPSVAAARKLRDFVAEIRKRGFGTPVVADVHFLPAAAMEAALWVEKVRINPGNFADRKKFVVREYTDAEYRQELERVERTFVPLVLRLKQLGRALRIGVNHGSLSDRIMNRYGDTPLGMVESALEFVRICRKHNYHDIVISMKSSNVKVMIQANRLLVARLAEEGPDWNYPLHLGVTEAGEGEDARIKSAIGIGALLADGIGDTIRVSLTEPSINELPFCRQLVEWAARPFRAVSVEAVSEARDPFSYKRRGSRELQIAGVGVGGANPVRVCAREGGEFSPDAPQILEVNPLAMPELAGQPVRLLTVGSDVPLEPIAAYRLLAARAADWPILLRDHSGDLVSASVNLGALLCDGIGDAIEVDGPVSLAYGILQAAGCRYHKAEYIACPSCGRTQFDLQAVTARIKERTQHLRGVKIAIMGCIVNGPGEMADADFGYVGTAPGRVSLWVGKQPVKEHIPEEQAVEELVALIKQHGKWVEPS